MHTFASRAGRWPLALTFATIAALGACADDELPATAPLTHPDKPHLAVGDVITVTSARGTADPGTLRWAVAQATGGEIIRFDPRLAGTTITLDTTLVIAKYLTIEGPPNRGIGVSGGGKGRVIDIVGVAPGQPATKLVNLSITGGKLTFAGGGAGVRTTSPLTIEHSTLWGNEASGSPAILALTAGPLTLLNTTVSGNTSISGYEAITSGVVAMIENSTIAYNSHGGIWFNDGAGGTLRNSIIANNGTYNCSTLTNVRYAGTNLSDNTSCGDSTEMRIADPKLEPLRDNGGPAMTHAITPESPAFNAAPACGLQFDERYEPRDGSCDIGAFESTDPTTVALTIDRVASVGPVGNYAGVSGTVACSRSGDQFTVQVTVQQRAPDKKTFVEGTVGVSVTCTTAAQPWSAQLAPSSGAFRASSASAAVVTRQTPSWVTPGTASRSIKLVAS